MKLKKLPNLYFILGISLGLVLGLVFVGLPAVAQQGPLGQSFTYQGRLRHDGRYVSNVTCDFRFGLYDTPAVGSGTPLGTGLQSRSLPVRDGYFVTSLDFGDVFNGDDRYLEVAVQCPTDAAYVSMDRRITINAVPYALHAANVLDVPTITCDDVTGKPAGLADDVDNVVTYSAGYGLQLSGQTFSVVTSSIAAGISTNEYQARIDESCSGLQAIKQVNADGSVICQTANITYTAGEGLELTGSVFSIDDSVVQRRVGSVCGEQTAIQEVTETGGVVCGDIPQGDLEDVQAGDGLTRTVVSGNGQFSVTLEIPDGAITTSMLATDAVSTTQLADGAARADQIGDDQVDSSHILTGAVQFDDLAENGCTDGQLMRWDSGAWICSDDTEVTYTTGDGLELSGGVLSVNTGDGVTIAGATGSEYVAIDFAGSGGDLGSADSLPRSDHTHGADTASRYVEPDDDPGGSVSGSYDTQFTVTELFGEPVSTSTPSDDQILRYQGGTWSPADYNGTLNLSLRIVTNSSGDSNGQVYANCASDELATGGGCQCDGGSQVEDSDGDSSNPLGTGWYCNCDNGSSTGNTAYVICLDQTYN